jgi:hypothetical protein
MTAAAMAVLRAMTLSNCNCSVGTSNYGSCGNSRGEDNANGGNGVGDDRHCCHRYFPLHHPQRRCQCHCLCCCHPNCICQHAAKKAMARVTRAMATVTKRAMESAARAMATSTKRARARAARGMGTAKKREMTRSARAMAMATRVACN